MPDQRTPFEEPQLLADLQALYAPARKQYQSLRYSGPEPAWEPMRASSRIPWLASAAILLFSVGLLWHSQTQHQDIHPHDPPDISLLAAAPAMQDFSPSRLRRPTLQRLRLSGRLQRPKQPDGKAYRLRSPRAPRPSRITPSSPGFA